MRGRKFIWYLQDCLKQKRFPGLYYIDERKGIFAVAWVHRSKNVSEIEEGDSIYKGWRENGGLDKSNKSNSYMKAQFRSSLNHHVKSKTIRRVTDPLYKDKFKNFRVYQFIDETNHHSHLQKKRSHTSHGRSLSPAAATFSEIQDNIPSVDSGISSLNGSPSLPNVSPSASLISAFDNLDPDISSSNDLQLSANASQPANLTPAFDSQTSSLNDLSLSANALSLTYPLPAFGKFESKPQSPSPSFPPINQSGLYKNPSIDHLGQSFERNYPSACNNSNLDGVTWFDINNYIMNNYHENDDISKFDDPCDVADSSRGILQDEWSEIDYYVQNLVNAGSNPSSPSETQYVHDDDSQEESDD